MILKDTDLVAEFGSSSSKPSPALAATPSPYKPRFGVIIRRSPAESRPIAQSDNTGNCFPVESSFMANSDVADNHKNTDESDRQVSPEESHQTDFLAQWMRGRVGKQPTQTDKDQYTGSDFSGEEDQDTGSDFPAKKTKIPVAIFRRRRYGCQRRRV